MFSFKSRAWQFGLTLLLLGFTYALSLTPPVMAFESDLFLYIAGLRPAEREGVALQSIRLAPPWSLLLTYGLILAIYVRRFTRSPTNAVSVLTVLLLLFALLMLEVLFAVFVGLFLPVMFPALVMLLLSLAFWGVEAYRRIALGSLARDGVTLDDIRRAIEREDLKTALFLLKQCRYRDELLEVGYELGMRLESRKHWASALNLYHWLSLYDPGLGDFVSRIEEIRSNRAKLIELGKSTPIAEPESPRVGNYRLVRKLAKGATAVVYEAVDQRTHNRVALKLMAMPPDEKIERDRIRQWLHEAEIVAGLEHDNIVKIHDAGILGNNAYIAMDYVSGYSMSLRLRKREYLTVGECIRITKNMLHGLAIAHASGIVHGDIKPANILYDTERDTYILTDFGAAYTGGRGRHGENVIMGTPAYMSPEQLEGKKLDGRSDLFSLAVTLYHLLTGQQPFAGSTLPELKKHILADEPDLNHLTLPAGIAEVLLKALQKKPYMRFADARQMLTSVEFCEAQLRERLRDQSGGSFR